MIFCGRQGIALRGHRDFGMLTTENPIENYGNFRALMRFNMNATKLSGDETYELARTNCAVYKLEDSKRNYQFLSCFR